MIKTIAIKNTKQEPMLVIWETGRRCNYDCTYCESTRHDNHSSLHSLEEYLKTLEFIKQWTDTYNDHRIIKSETHLIFTGGEPTVNPDFWNLIDIIKSDHKEFKLALTTNGAWSPKNTEKISNYFNSVTVSYHAEADKFLKDQVIHNILLLHKSKIWLQVNVMLHTDHWNECVEVYEMLKSTGIRANLRPIGDGNILRKGWFIDADGKQRRTSHDYTEEQKQWFFEQSGVSHKSSGSSSGQSLGRSCCGGRCLQGKVDGEWKDVGLINTEFKNWQCMVDWYFLHIDQHTGLIHHHQTCKALHDNQRGSLGSINESEKLIQELKLRLKNPVPIVCPNDRCGCGMCVPKAKNKEDFDILWNSVVRSSVY